MALVVFGVLMVVALLFGVLGNRWWARHDASSEEGLSISDLVTPLTTLAVVLLAFVMVEAISSYGRAREQIGTEARVVNEMGDSATRVADPAISTALQQDLICYSRAVVHREWPAMAGATGERAPEVGVWTGDIRAQLDTLAKGGGGDVSNRLIDLDGRRGEARLARLTESQPTIPTGLNLLMYASIILSVFGLAFFVRAKGHRGVYLALLAAFTVVLAATLYTISDLDAPFSGLNQLPPTEMTRIQSSLETTYARISPAPPLPCNSDGAKL
ncbi:MAG: hypothetical protein M3010_00120 [Candidatus Dormibacteraeota bacterium]|nr:hypothetical protein [Candidatus Dormibacteraeota bacterium]